MMRSNHSYGWNSISSISSMDPGSHDSILLPDSSFSLKGGVC